VLAVTFSWKSAADDAGKSAADDAREPATDHRLVFNSVNAGQSAANNRRMHNPDISWKSAAYNC
jgi:hypothetical protein